MKIAIPSMDGKLCSHFGHCENFTFVEVDEESNIIKKDIFVPEGGVSCQSASWICEQGADLVLAGGMGGRPLSVFAENGVEVVTGCPELDIEPLVKIYLSQELKTTENSCGGEHSHCHGHDEGHHCGHHH